jgi:hypothetical protein
MIYTIGIIEGFAVVFGIIIVRLIKKVVFLIHVTHVQKYWWSAIHIIMNCFSSSMGSLSGYPIYAVDLHVYMEMPHAYLL